MRTPDVARGSVTLAPDEASRLRSQHPELGGPDATDDEQLVLAISARDPAEAAALSDLVAAARLALVSTRGPLQEVLAALLPEDRLTLTPALVSQVQRNATAQAELAAEFGLLSSADVAGLAGSRAANPAALASRWRKEGRLFGIELGGSVRYPGFQFDARGKPLPVVAQVLEALRARLSGWELALWFTGANDWLGGVRPVEVLGTDDGQVVEAARKLADEILT